MLSSPLLPTAMRQGEGKRRMTEEVGDKKREMITFGCGKRNKKHPEDCFSLCDCSSSGKFRLAC